MNAKQRAFALSVVLILAFSAAVSARQNSTVDSADSKSTAKSAPAQPSDQAKTNSGNASKSGSDQSGAESKAAPADDESSTTEPAARTAGAPGKTASSSSPSSKTKATKTVKTKRKGKAAAGKNAVKLSGKTEKATFAAGCFWSVEAVFERVPGVISVVSGFSGGNVPNPSYQMVCTGRTGHAESVQVTFDPEVCPYENLLKVFWSVHDPTTWNAQGDDHGPQYRSVIFYHNDAQKEAALKSYKQLTAAGTFGAPIVTQLMPMKTFFPAEDYHQNYYRNHMYEQYADIYITPKIEKLRKKLHLR